MRHRKAECQHEHRASQKRCYTTSRGANTVPAMSERNRAGPFSSVAVSDGERGEGHPCKVVIHKGANCVTSWRNARCVVAYSCQYSARHRLSPFHSRTAIRTPATSPVPPSRILPSPSIHFLVERASFHSPLPRQTSTTLSDTTISIYQQYIYTSNFHLASLNLNPQWKPTGRPTRISI